MATDEASVRMLFPYLGLVLVVVLNVCANILLKIGSGKANDASLLSLVNLPIVSGIGCFALAVLAYAASLRTVPLHVAQSMLSLQYVGVVVAAAVVFGEVPTPRVWLGAGLIAAGLTIVVTASLR